MRRLFRNTLPVLLLILPLALRANPPAPLRATPPVSTGPQILAALVSLCDPAKLATLSKREANPRVLKIVYWLETARRQGSSPRKLMETTMSVIGWPDARGALTTTATLRNLSIATKLGCTDDAGMEAMRHGQSPTVRKGPCAGDALSVDHIIPLAKHPEFGCVLANLELLPLRLNMKKSATMGRRQYALLAKFQQAGLGIRTP